MVSKMPARIGRRRRPGVASPRIPRGLAAFVRAAAFAWRLADRYLGRLWPWPGLGMVFKQSRGGVMMSGPYQRLYFKFSPRFSMTLLINRGSGRQDLPASPSQEQVRMTPPSPPARIGKYPRVQFKHLASRLWQGRAEAAAATRLERQLIIHRITADLPAASARLEPGGSREAAQAQPSWTSWAQPVSRISRRSLPAVAEPRPRPRSAAPPVPRVFQPPPSLKAEAAPSGPIETAEVLQLPGAAAAADLKKAAVPGAAEFLEINLDHLTERVLKAIDQRFIAHRERFGRI